MGVATGALIAAGVSAAAGAYGANQAKKGAQGAANATIRAQDAAYYRNQQNMQPWLTAGTNALAQIQQLDAGNTASFTEAPDYAWTRDEGIKALDRSAAADGSLYSGGQDADIVRYASGLASQNYQTYRNNLVQLAGMGQSAGGALAGVNTGYANAVGNANSNLAQSNANTNSQLVAGLAGLANNYANSRTSAYGGVNGYSAYPNLLTQQVNSGQGSNVNFGNNVSGFSGGW
ncbi:hypothetical protein [Xanthomonas sp. WHRI 7945]|nr:hypothetical protein [Xanthomonas campestris pv. campestris]